MIRKVMINTVWMVLMIAISGLVYIRLAPVDGSRWHVDPLTVTRPDRPNSYLLRPVDGDGPSVAFSLAPNILAFELQKMAEAMPRTDLIYGSTGKRHMTFISRTPVLGFPDFITVKILETEGGSKLVIYSRSQYGYSDIGVNHARVTNWIKLLKAFEQS